MRSGFEAAAKAVRISNSRPMLLGKGGSVHVLAIYVENTVPNLILEESVLGRMFIEMTDKTPGEVYQAVEANSLGLSEAEPLPTREEAMDAMLAGNLLLLVDGYDKGLKIGSKGYPSRSVDTTDTEKVLRGCERGIYRVGKDNTALIRKRIPEHGSESGRADRRCPVEYETGTCVYERTGIPGSGSSRSGRASTGL